MYPKWNSKSGLAVSTLVSKTELAEALKISKSDLHALMKLSGFPKSSKRGGWKVEECKKFIATLQKRDNAKAVLRVD